MKPTASLSALAAALKVLQASGKPLHYQEITRCVFPPTWHRQRPVILLAFAFVCGTVSPREICAASITNGATASEVYRILGKPMGRIQRGDLTILMYSHAEVHLHDGHVTTSRATSRHTSEPDMSRPAAPFPTRPTLYQALTEAWSLPAGVSSPQDAVSLAERATVLIEGSEGSGAGFFISPDGYIVTSYHVIERCRELSVRTFDGHTYKPTHIAALSIPTDVAVLKVDGGPFQYLRPQLDVSRGQKLLTIGHPHGQKWVYSEGYVASVAARNGRHEIQFSTDISPGNSGGAMFDEDGSFCALAAYYYVPQLQRAPDGAYILDPSRVFKFGIATKSVIDLLMSGPDRRLPIRSDALRAENRHAFHILAQAFSIMHLIAAEFVAHGREYHGWRSEERVADGRVVYVSVFRTPQIFSGDLVLVRLYIQFLKSYDLNCTDRAALQLRHDLLLAARLCEQAVLRLHNANGYEKQSYSGSGALLECFNLQGKYNTQMKTCAGILGRNLWLLKEAPALCAVISETEKLIVRYWQQDGAGRFDPNRNYGAALGPRP